MLRTLTTAALLVLAATAVQAEPLENASIAVAYGDLNLSSPSDAKVLAERLQTAAKQVCTFTNYDLSKAAMSTCMGSAISAATYNIEAQINSHTGDAVHANLTTMRQQISLK
jgi:UrcA family protein